MTWWGSALVQGAGGDLPKGQGSFCGFCKVLADEGRNELDAGGERPQANVLLCANTGAGSGKQPTPLLAIPLLQMAATPQSNHLEENADFSLYVWNYIRMRERVTSLLLPTLWAQTENRGQEEANLGLQLCPPMSCIMPLSFPDVIVVSSKTRHGWFLTKLKLLYASSGVCEGQNPVSY